MCTVSGSIEEPLAFGAMKSPGGEISLKSVDVCGTVDGLVFSSRITQTYRNETEEALEIIYTFPVGWKTALLEMKARIGEKWLDGEVVEKQAAEKKYEDAVSKGDAAIMVAESASGLHTANLGNIKPGETVEVMIHCARLLSFEQDRIRLCLPTVVGERYGDPCVQGGLSRHESVTPDRGASYSFGLQITVLGEMAKSRISCPSHPVHIQEAEGKVKVELDSGARLDRDFVLILEGLAGRSHAATLADDKLWMTAASFAPRVGDVQPAPLGLKILIDCSGSMSGESIAQAQKGLGRVLRELEPRDYVSYSRFGSEVAHLDAGLQLCDRDCLGRLSRAIEDTSADMGGTEMEKALESVLMLKEPEEAGLAPAILLITDGHVWDVKNIIATARQGGQRIFVIGVGSAPAESLLRNLASETGGVCEFVTPNEGMAEAIVRMFRRMRSGLATNIRVNWGEKPVWESSLPKCVHDGDTVHCFALLAGKPETGPELVWTSDNVECRARAERVEESRDIDLLRLGGRARLETADSRKAKLELALKYQLVSDVTSMILVFERPEGERTKGLPKIQRVPQMPAHGHGCNFMLAGGVASFGFASMSQLASGPDLSFFSRRRMGDGRPAKTLDLAAVLKKKPKHDYSIATAPLVSLWQERLHECRTMGEFIALVASSSELDELGKYVRDLASARNLPVESIWTALVEWILEKNCALDRHSLRLLNSAGVDADLVRELKEQFEKDL